MLPQPNGPFQRNLTFPEDASGPSAAKTQAYVAREKLARFNLQLKSGHAVMTPTSSPAAKMMFDDGSQQL